MDRIFQEIFMNSLFLFLFHYVDMHFFNQIIMKSSEFLCFFSL